MIEQIQETLQRATFDSNSQVGIIFHVMDALESPPTYFRTNHFTNAFQEIVDAYGLVLQCMFLFVIFLLEKGFLQWKLHAICKSSNRNLANERS